MGAAPREQHRTTGPVRVGVRRVMAGVLAATLGFSGAAVFDALFLSTPAVADDFGPAGDGLTRYVVQPDGARVTDEELARLEAVRGVAHAQRLFNGARRHR